MVAPFGLSIAQQIAARFAAQPEVTAVALGGSRSTGAADPRADIDLYVYAAPPIAVATRAAIASAMAAPGPREIDNHFWEPGDEWALASADDTLRIDIMYRAPAWIEAELDRVLVRHEASLGYSTCLWHNVRHASVLYDRDGWFAQLQGIAAAPYPEELRRATVATNRAVVRGIHSSLAAPARTRGRARGPCRGAAPTHRDPGELLRHPLRDQPADPPEREAPRRPGTRTVRPPPGQLPGVTHHPPRHATRTGDARPRCHAAERPGYAAPRRRFTVSAGYVGEPLPCR